ncbi:hypothetical protein TELCIR_14932 [Teladorsagia circumcincta]|uniref:Uncharacterized protein n=1 Tax=Teladorsagia circumcincta TaxID=45464 RepID=A0A2G9TZY2_TELCI|nr:hypothetical protein TELCIR_14932 [Teladorsagia circumcincta]
MLGDFYGAGPKSEAMAISLKLISDSRYNGIEEEVEAHKDVLGSRERSQQHHSQKVRQLLYQEVLLTLVSDPAAFSKAAFYVGMRGT